MELKHLIQRGNNKLNLLLIVPYGIETLLYSLDYHNLDCLLIVPYGIETRKPYTNGRTKRPFNRTLWN